jgi:CheY-like chemotaxis protein
VGAGDGVEALEMLSDQRVDLVLMDCQMPVMDGYTATQQWRAREHEQGRSRLPIVALTANAYEEDVVHAREAGMDAHLAKPYTREQLREMLARWL